jgi:hypothetical protein
LFDASKDIESGLLEKLRLSSLNLTSNGSLPVTNTSAPFRGENLKVPLMQYVERMDRSFYYYEGSLTTPPCSEHVHFLVMNEIQYITFADIQQFQRFWGSNQRFARGKGNNRVVQPINGRAIYFKELTLRERYEELTNHFMMPDNQAVIGLHMGAALLLSLISALY